MVTHKIKHDDWFLLALFAATPHGLVGDRAKVEFEESDIDGLDFEEFQDGTCMNTWSKEELLELAKENVVSWRQLSQELVVRAEMLEIAIGLVEEDVSEEEISKCAHTV